MRCWARVAPTHSNDATAHAHACLQRARLDGEVLRIRIRLVGATKFSDPVDISGKLSAKSSSQHEHNFAKTALEYILEMYTIRALATLSLASMVASQTGVTRPLARSCTPNLPRVVCINKYAAVMPFPFSRPFSGDNFEDSYDFVNTLVPADKSFALVNISDFLVFDHQRGLDILGPNPSYERMFEDPGNHESPVYVPGLNKIILQRLVSGNLAQLVIDLNHNPPTLYDNYLPDPPIFAPDAAAYHNGLIYFAAVGSTDNTTLGGGVVQRSGIKTLDPVTNKTTTLLNNYFGLLFTTVDDLFVHPVTGDVWFTDNEKATNSAYVIAYGYAFAGFTVTQPQLESAVYRFRPSTGAVQVVEDTLQVPNGIGLSPDLKTVYISDTGAISGSTISPSGLTYNTTGKRSIYAYDLSPDGTYITNKRAIYLAQGLIADGLRLARNGYLVTAAGRGADVLDARGELILRVKTGFVIESVAFAGKNMTELWLMGTGAIGRVQWALQGPVLK
ncbi:MAG: hypothetical protein Q9217_005257 [Psora testacea]